jgi:flavin-dependent dehydrogenase
MIEQGRVTGIRGHGPDGRRVTERARVVVGADGSRSRVARAVGAAEYHAQPELQAGFYTFWSDLPVDGMEVVIRPGRGFAALPTNDGLTMVVVGWQIADHAANKRDVERSYLDTVQLSPAFADRLGHARREARFAGMPVAGFFRTPLGPGWALVGDAGYTKDPITGQGISDAFRSAELCAAALDAALSGRSTYDDAMAGYQLTRDEHALPMYGFTCELATLAPPPPELQQLLGAIHGHPAAMDAFVSVFAGTVSPATLFDPDFVRNTTGLTPTS